MTVTFVDTNKTPDKVYYGTGGKLDQIVTSGSGTQKSVTLQSLMPDTDYQYKISATGKVYSFHTAPTTIKPFKFVAFGDSRDGSSSIKLKINHAVASEHPAFVLSTGDVTSNGSNPSLWGSQFFSCIGEISPYFPFMVALGNHEMESSLFNAYLKFPDAGKWYSFAYENVRFIALDVEANYSPGSAQYKFLETTLKNSKEQWKIVYFHEPPYSTNSGHGSNLKVRSTIVPLLEKYKVDVVFNGHNHCYERTKPINGITYVVTAGAGAQLYSFNAAASWDVVRNKTYNYVVANMNGNKLSLTAKNLNGKVIDNFSISK